VNIDRILADLKAERARLEDAIAALEGGRVSTPGRRGGRGRRHMSAAARRRISEAMRARWAERKKKSKVA
jgi:hypothetical protein